MNYGLIEIVASCSSICCRLKKIDKKFSKILTKGSSVNLLIALLLGSSTIGYFLSDSISAGYS